MSYGYDMEPDALKDVMHDFGMEAPPLRTDRLKKEDPEDALQTVSDSINESIAGSPSGEPLERDRDDQMSFTEFLPEIDVPELEPHIDEVARQDEFLDEYQFEDHDDEKRYSGSDSAKLSEQRLEEFWRGSGIAHREAFGSAVNFKPTLNINPVTGAITVMNPNVDFVKRSRDGEFDGLDDAIYETVLGAVEKESALFYGQPEISLVQYIDACVAAIYAEVSTNWTDIGMRNALKAAVDMFMEDVMSILRERILQHLHRF